jgi:hypothetical protein
MGLRMSGVAAILCGLALPVLASDARTSATAGSNGRGSGTAGATAAYEGDIGFARTKADTGKINLARGLAVGFDEDGLSVSHSYALAPTYGPAVGGTFNMHIGLDGEASVSSGHVKAAGDRNRVVNAGGSAGSDGRSPYAVATASGETGRRGEVRAETRSISSASNRARPAERVAYRPASTRAIRGSAVSWR